MNILYLAHRIPFPPNKGEKIRSFHQIRHLAQNHAVHLACLVDDREDLPHLKSLQSYCASVDAAYRNRAFAGIRALAGLPGTEPLSVLAFHSRALRDKILRRLQTTNIDVVLAFSSVMAHYVSRDLAIPKVMDFVDVDSEKWRVYAEHHGFPLSWLYRLEGERLGRHEEQVANFFDHSLVVSEAEAALLQRRVGARPMTVIPNGVDLNYFAPAEEPAEDFRPPIMVFTGAMDYFPNADAVSWFCRHIFPVIRKSVPDARFHIVGRNPIRTVRRLARMPGVVVTGTIPDIRPYLARAAVAVAPLRIARGVQNKILEAMAMGLPVVCSSEAYKGVPGADRGGVLKADDPREFAETVLRLLNDPGCRRDCARRARQAVEQTAQWSIHGAALEALLEKVVRGWHLPADPATPQRDGLLIR